MTSSSTGSSPVYYTKTYTFTVTSTDLSLLSGSTLSGKMITIVAVSSGTLQAYSEHFINKLSTTPVLTEITSIANGWSSLTVTAASATSLTVVVTQVAASTAPTTVSPTLTIQLLLCDY
jgi:hypothetical protein